MFEVIGPGYRIQDSSFPGWSELGRKVSELPRDFSLEKVHAHMDIAQTMHYACRSMF